MDIAVDSLPGPIRDAAAAEAVERKGLGHPDTICDALAEELGLALSRAYLERAGAILHHNVDKALLWAGRAAPCFGGGEVLAPLEIYLAGRAAGAGDLPVEAWTRDCVERWLRANLPALDVERHVRIHCLVRPGSEDLASLFDAARADDRPLANDTSCGVGFAPLSELERVVLEAERVLNCPERRRSHPALGPDVKVMGTRLGERIHLTVACALVDRHLAGPDDYAAAVDQVGELVRARTASLTRRAVEVVVNGADDPACGRFYLTVTGTSAEAGDDGQAGRGNRVNGLITPYRPMTLESVAGKNPITHVGKLYNLCAGLLAEELAASLPGVAEAECRLVSRIGRPVDDPQFVEVGLRSAEPIPSSVRKRASEITRAHVGRIGTLWRELLDGTLVLDGWPLRRGPTPGSAF